MFRPIGLLALAAGLCARLAGCRVGRLVPATRAAAAFGELFLLSQVSSRGPFYEWAGCHRRRWFRAGARTLGVSGLFTSMTSPSPEHAYVQPPIEGPSIGRR